MGERCTETGTLWLRGLVFLVVGMVCVSPSLCHGGAFRDILAEAGVLDNGTVVPPVLRTATVAYDYRIYYYDPLPVTTTIVYARPWWHHHTYWRACYFRHPSYLYHYRPRRYHRRYRYHHPAHHRPTYRGAPARGRWSSRTSSGHAVVAAPAPSVTVRSYRAPSSVPGYRSGTAARRYGGAPAGSRYQPSPPSVQYRTQPSSRSAGRHRSHSSTSRQGRSYGSAPAEASSGGRMGGGGQSGGFGRGGRAGRVSRY